MPSFLQRRSTRDRAAMIRTEPLRLVRSEQADRLAAETFDILVGDLALGAGDLAAAGVE